MDNLKHIVSVLVFWLVIATFLVFTGWVFWLTRNPWSFAILLFLSGFSMGDSKKEEK